MTKRECKSAYMKSEIDLSDAMNILMDEFDMERGEVFRYLGFP
jgi:hypothetical protein